MNGDDRTITGVEDTDGLRNLRDAVVQLVAKENQRREDKVDSDILRAEVRATDREWKSGVEERLGRVQSDVANLRRTVDDLPTTLDAKLRDTSDQVKTDAAKVAAELVVATEVTAAHLKTATTALALVQKENADRRAARRSLSAGTKAILTFLFAIAIVATALVVFTDSDGLAPSIAIFAAVSGTSLTILKTVIWTTNNQKGSGQSYDDSGSKGQSI